MMTKVNKLRVTPDSLPQLTITNMQCKSANKQCFIGSNFGYTAGSNENLPFFVISVMKIYRTAGMQISAALFLNLLINL